jgi:hypothetical protein
MLCFEITEHAAIADMKKTIALIEALRSRFRPRLLGGHATATGASDKEARVSHATSDTQRSNRVGAKALRQRHRCQAQRGERIAHIG